LVDIKRINLSSMNNNQTIKAVIGLGNPGKEYVGTRHNAGFIVLDNLSNCLPGKHEYKNAYNGSYYQARLRSRKVLFLKPLTFMNLSGQSVLSLCKKENIITEELLVIYDDMDLPLGKIRIKPSGGSAGHNGVESIISKLGSNNFARLRIGIGKTTSDGVIDHVLSEFNKEDKEIFNNVVDLSVAAVKLSLCRDIQSAMNEFNGKNINIVKSTTNEVKN